MKAKFAPLALAVVASSAFAGEIGSPEVTAEAGDLTLGIGYYYDQGNWSTGSAQGDSIVGSVVRDGPYAKLAFGLHKDWEVVAKAGLESVDTDPDRSGGDVASHEDGFYGLGVNGIVYRKDRWALGPFLQFSEYSDYTVSGEIASGNVLVPVTANVKSLSTIQAGLAAQYDADKFDLFGGLYYNDASANVSGTYDSNAFDADLAEDADVGAYVGMNLPLGKKWVATGELHGASDLGVAVSVNYLIGHKQTPPTVITQTQTETRTETVIQTVYVDTSKAVGPARFETDVHFATGSAEVDSEHWVNIREFAEFLNRYPKSRGIIEGHCDCDGKDDYNTKLSERRASAIQTLLVKLYGIDPARLEVQNFGETQPVASNETKEGKAANRRVRMVGIAE